MYWSSASGEWSASGGVGGATEVSGVYGSLSVVVRSMIGLMVEFVLVSGVLFLSVVMPGLSFMSAAVEAIVVMSESVSGSQGGRGSGMGCAGWWLGGTVLAVLWGGTCWAVHKQAQSSLMVWHWNAGGAGVWIMQCWCRVCRSCFLSLVTSIWLTFRTVALSVVMRRSMGEREVRRCVRRQNWVARRYANTKMPQS